MFTWQRLNQVERVVLNALEMRLCRLICAFGDAAAIVLRTRRSTKKLS
jgi:hypothetical protein